MPQNINLLLANGTNRTGTDTNDKSLKNNLFSQYLLSKDLLPKQVADRDDIRKSLHTNKVVPGSSCSKASHQYHPYSSSSPLKFPEPDFSSGKNMESLWQKILHVKPGNGMQPIDGVERTNFETLSTSSVRPFIRLSDDAWQRLMNQLKEKGQALNKMEEESRYNSTITDVDDNGVELHHLPDYLSTPSSNVMGPDPRCPKPRTQEPGTQITEPGYPKRTDTDFERRHQLADAKLPLPQNLLRKKWSQMKALQNLSKLKAMVHIAEVERQDSQHRREEARRQFLADLAEELQLMSSAKIAELQAAKDYKSLILAEKLLSDKDRDIHELLEKENSLYEDLTEAEACLARADMNFIPTIKSENQLKAFASFLNFGF